VILADVIIPTIPGCIKSSLLICNLFRLYICTLDLNNASVEQCNSFLSVNTILDMKCYVLHFI